MGFTTNTSSNISEQNSNATLSCPGFNAYFGNIISCTNTTITLDSSASSNDDEYNSLLIEITSGYGGGTFRIISDYNGTTKVCTVSKLGELPNSDSTYVIHKYSGILGSQNQSGKHFNIKFPSHLSSTDNFYLNQFIKIIHQDFSYETKFIDEYDGTNKIAHIKTQWDTDPLIYDFFIVSGESGIVVDGTSNTLTLSENCSDSVITGLLVEIVSGIGKGQTRTITSISGNVVTLNSVWDTIPDDSSFYRVFSGWMGTFESSDGYSQVSYMLSTGKNEKLVCVTTLSNDEFNTGALYYLKESYNSEKITHNFNAKGNYFKLIIITMGSSLSGYIATNKDFVGNPETIGINRPITNTTDVNVVRSVITGKSADNGAYKNIQTDSYGNLNVNIMQPIDIFGNLVTAEPKVMLEMKFPYTTSHYLQDYFMRGTGTMYNSGNGMLNVCTAVPNTSPSTESMSRLKSIQRSHYSGGLALRITFSAVFSNPVAGCRQIIGHGDQNNGVFFGYNGYEFGIMRRYSGKSEIRTLTIETEASSTGNIVIELDGVTTNIPVVTGDSIYTIAEKIANGVKVAPYYLQTHYAYMKPGWLSYLDRSNKIQFLAEDSGPHAGNYSVSGQGVTGSFSRIQTGVSAVDDWTYVYDWIYDRMDGTNALPVLDFTKGNIFEIDMQWLGFGNIAFKIENPTTGRFITTHIIRYPNKYSSPSLHVPNQPLMLEAYNGTTTDYVSVSTSCMTSHTLGNHNMYNATRFGTSEIKKKSVSKGKRYNILTLRNCPTIMNTTNVTSQLGLSIASSWKANSAAIFHVIVNAKIEIPYNVEIDSPGTDYTANEICSVTGGSGTGMKIKVLSVGSSGEVLEIKLDVPGSGYIEQDNVTLTGGNGCTVNVNHIALTWVDRKSNISTAVISTDYVEVTGGEEQFSIAMGSNSSFFETFNDMEIYMPPMYSISLAIQPIADEVDAEFSSSFFWSEKH